MIALLLTLRYKSNECSDSNSSHFHLGQMEASYLGIWSSVCLRVAYFAHKSRKSVLQMVG